MTAVRLPGKPFSRRCFPLLSLIAFILLNTGPVVRPALAWQPGKVVQQERSGGLYSGAYKIRNKWDREAEAEFSKWVEAIGLARETQSFRIPAGFKNPAINPLYTPEDENLRMLVDCGELPYAMRAYFAYKTGRPFSFVATRGKRYRGGNKPLEYMDFSQFKDFNALASMMLSRVTTATYRVHPTYEGTDTYVVDVRVDTVVPGTVYYDPNGHVMLIYRVDHDSGEIFMLDSHPDGTLTRKMFNPSYGIGRGKAGGGFRNWRHYQIAVTDEAKGAFRIVRDLNKESFGWDPKAQYLGLYQLDGFELTYHEWVKARISKNGIYLWPVPEFSSAVDNLCLFVQDRVGAVHEAVGAGLHQRKHPPDLPANIYGADGDWEAYASPGRDARLRFQVFQLRSLLAKAMRMALAGDKRLKYEGTAQALLKDFLIVWGDRTSKPECRFTYVNSAGANVTLSLADVLARVYDLSFDPYHCPELRWGAPMKDAAGKATAEYATCPENKNKLWWYKEEERLRRRMTRVLNRNTSTTMGPSNPADINVLTLLYCYQTKPDEMASCHANEKTILEQGE